MIIYVSPRLNSPVFLLVYSQTDRLRGFGSFVVAFRSLSLLSLLPWSLLEVQSAFRAAWTICGALYFYLSITNCFQFSECFRENFLHIEFFFPCICLLFLPSSSSYKVSIYFPLSSQLFVSHYLNINIIVSFLLSFTPSKISHIPHIAFFSNPQPLFHCYYVHICTSIYIYIYIPRYNLFSLHSVTCMYIL